MEIFYKYSANKTSTLWRRSSFPAPIPFIAQSIIIMWQLISRNNNWFQYLTCSPSFISDMIFCNSFIFSSFSFTCNMKKECVLKSFTSLDWQFSHKSAIFMNGEAASLITSRLLPEKPVKTTFQRSLLMLLSIPLLSFLQEQQSNVHI